MKNTVAVFPGTFDPLTRGHEDLVRRAALLFERVIVAVAASRREALFSHEERIALAAEALRPLGNVEVAGFDCLLVDLLRQRGARIIVRGARTVADFEYETQMAVMNRKLYSDLETVFLPPAEEHRFLSATVVREIARHGGDVSDLVPPAILPRLRQKFHKI
ncbi:MAG: pantetheine-phosphate adenylyltransferase [Azoarcus sp.]|jgi:pantetheine-phosphate adenylyltransferase|nr:pantetheine-phosphate adenylyltransferase [Azoarcus sp.]